MKYYKNLIKNKNYFAVIFSILLTVIGVIITYDNFLKFIMYGIQGTNEAMSVVADVPAIVNIFASSNIGLALIGLSTIYLGIIMIPRWAEGSQDDGDYKIDFQEENIYVKYKKNEFIVSKKNHDASDFFFKDKNNKFVSLTRGYQIYNYVIIKERELRYNKQSNEGKKI